MLGLITLHVYAKTCQNAQDCSNSSSSMRHRLRWLSDDVDFPSFVDLCLNVDPAWIKPKLLDNFIHVEFSSDLTRVILYNDCSQRPIQPRRRQRMVSSSESEPETL